MKNLLESVPKSAKQDFMSAYEIILNEGIEKGKDKWLKEGIESEKIKTVLRGFDIGLDLSTIAGITDLPLEKVAEIIKANTHKRA